MGKVLTLPINDLQLPLPPQAPALPSADPLTPTIFHEEWWLNIVTGGDYNVAEVRENGQVAGRLPYFLRKRFGLKYSIMPPMTHFLGPAIVEGDGSPPTRFLRNAAITRELIAQLPPAALYRYKCHRDITDAIAFQQENFHTSVQFTHEILPGPEELLWKNLRSKKRKKIRAAQDKVTLCDIHDPMEFWRMYDSNLQHKGTHNLCDQKMVCSLIDACLLYDQGRIIAAKDQKGQYVAALFCVWDKTSSFYFMSTRVADSHNGVVSLLAWEGVKDAAKRGLIFDFDGLNSSKGVLFFTEFGGTICPRYIVTRHNLLGRLALGIKDRSRESRFFY